MLLGNNKKKTQRKPNQICDPITTFVTDKTDAGEGGSYLWIEKLTGIGNGISPFPNSTGRAVLCTWRRKVHTCSLWAAHSRKGGKMKSLCYPCPLSPSKLTAFSWWRKVLPNEHALHGSISQTYTLVLCSINH